MTLRVLVIAPAGISEESLRGHVVQPGEEVELAVVSPASELSFGEWLANAEDDARREAEETAARTAEAVAGEGEVVRAEAGDTDPLVAAQDALRTFPADELVVVVPDGDEGRDATWLERSALDRFQELGLPVRHVRAGARPA